MCRRVTCPKCNKATFAGCGMHVEQVLADVPVEARCSCDVQAPPASGGHEAKRRRWWPFG